MELSGKTTSDQFDLSAYNTTATGLAILHGQLPEPALRSLANEVLQRIGDAARAHPKPHLPPQFATELSDIDKPANARVEQFCAALIAPDPTQAARVIERARRFGVEIDEVYLAYLTPAARRLGEWWENDRASFVEVTVGIARIYGIMRGLRDGLPLSIAPDAPHAVFANVPGCEHTLGVSVAADLFRNQGWDIDLATGLDHDALIARLKAHPAPILGLSASGAKHIPSLVRLLTMLRAARLPCRVVLSGRIAAERPDIAELTGLDAAGADFYTAREEIERLWRGLHRVNLNGADG